MTKLAPLALIVFLALPAVAQTPGQPPDQPGQPAPTPPQPQPAPQAAPPPPQRPAWKDKLFVGGAIGASFGTVDYIEIAPIVGYRVIPKLVLGGGVSYTYRNDDRYTPSFTANDYGASVFTQFYPYGPLFLQAEYNYQNYEYLDFDGTKSRSDYNSFLAGVGFNRSFKGGAGIYASILYNFSYDANDPFNPYSSPWVYRIGAGFAF